MSAAPTQKTASKSGAVPGAPAKLSLSLPAGTAKLLAFLFLVGAALLLWWGTAVQRPSLDPFSERDWWDWFLEPTPDPAYAALPVRPLGSGRGWMAKEFFANTEEPVSSGLRAVGSGALQIVPPDRFPTLATWAAVSPDGKQIGLMGGDGRAYLSGQDGWEVFDLLGAGLGDKQPLGQQQQKQQQSYQPPSKAPAASKPLRSLAGHEAPVTSVALSPDGRLLAGASKDNTVRLWDPATGKPLRTLAGHQGAVHSVAFSPDGRLLASASGDSTVRQWDPATGQALRTLAGHESSVYSVAFSPDGRLLASASSDDTVRLWDPATGQALRTLAGHESTVTSVAFTPDGRLLASASSDNTVRLWMAPGPPPPLVAATFDHKGAFYLTGGSVSWACRESRTGRWSPDSVRTFNEVVAMGFRPDGTLVALGKGSVARVYSSASDQFPEDLPEGTEFRNLAFLDDERGWIVGTEGLILETRDGGATWSLARSAPGESLASFHIAPSGAGWIAGEHRGRRFVLHKKDLKGDGLWRKLGHHTAPWVFFAGLPLMLLAGFVNLRIWTAQPPVVRRSIEGTASSDRPLSWSDKDALDLKPLALGLSRFLRNLNTIPPLTLAVTGGWGSGKSSLMNLLMTDLQRYGARPVWFNAWHHRDETHLLAALLENIRAQAIPGWYTWPGVTFRLRLLWRRTRGSLLNGLALVAFLAIAWWVVEMALDGPVDFGAVAKEILPWLDNAKAWLTAPAMGPMTPAEGMGGLLSFLLVLFLRAKLTALPANPAKLLSDLSRKASLRDFSDKLSFRYRFGKEFQDVCKALRTRRNPGLVILIDDLDRCQPDAVLKVLEAVNYFVSEGPCFVVLGMDRRQVEHAVGHGFKDIVEGLPDEELIYGDTLNSGGSEEKTQVIKRRAYARHYLEKLINIDVPVPTLSTEGVVRMLVDEGFEGDSDETRASRSDEPLWLGGFKRQAGTLVGMARVAVFSVALGLGAALLLEPYVGFSPTGTLQKAPVKPPAATQAEAPGQAVPSSEQTAKETVRFGEGIDPVLLAGIRARAEVPSARRYLWWGGTAFVLLIALLNASPPDDCGYLLPLQKSSFPSGGPDEEARRVSVFPPSPSRERGFVDVGYLCTRHPAERPCGASARFRTPSLPIHEIDAPSQGAAAVRAPYCGAQELPTQLTTWVLVPHNSHLEIWHGICSWWTHCPDPALFRWRSMMMRSRAQKPTGSCN